MISNWPVVTAMSYRNTAATISQTTRKAAKTNPTTVLARIISAGMPKTKKAMIHAADSPASAAPPAFRRPQASRPRRTKTGKAAANVEAGQFPRGS